MSTFKNINNSSTIIEKNVVSYKNSFTTSSAGIESIKIISGSKNNNYWSSLNVLFYTSGSPTYAGETKLELNNLSYKHTKQHLNKFHGYESSSLISIPARYYGERVTEKSFLLTDLNNSDASSNNPIIKDDGFGNLFSTNAHFSQSNNSVSSSDNYVGNIFYEHGIAIITETGSWSGSVNYSDLATNFTLDMDSHDTMYAHEYEVTMKPKEFNQTMNYTVRMPLSGTFPTLNDFTASLLSNEYIATTFTGSDFQPYITNIHLYQKDDYETPVLTATLVKPIRKSDKIDMVFKIKLDM